MCSSWGFVPEVIVLRHQKVNELGWGHIIQYVSLPHLKPQWFKYISAHSNVSYSCKFHSHDSCAYLILSSQNQGFTATDTFLFSLPIHNLDLLRLKVNTIKFVLKGTWKYVLNTSKF